MTTPFWKIISMVRFRNIVLLTFMIAVIGTTLFSETVLDLEKVAAGNDLIQKRMAQLRMQKSEVSEKTPIDSVSKPEVSKVKKKLALIKKKRLGIETVVTSEKVAAGNDLIQKRMAQLRKAKTKPALVEKTKPVEVDIIAKNVAKHKNNSSITSRDEIKYSTPKQTKRKINAVQRKTSTVYVREITFSGNSLYDRKTLTKVIGFTESGRFSLEDLKGMAARITEFYKSKNYFLARAVIPKQNFMSEIINIHVLEGQRGNIVVTGNITNNRDFIKSSFHRLKKDLPINEKYLERALLLLKDCSGLNISSVLKAGEKTGTTDIVVKADQTNMLDFALNTNNFGTKSSGRYRISPSLTFKNFSNRFDSLSLNLMSAPKSNDLLYGALKYVSPVGLNGGKFHFYANGGGFEVAREFSVLDIKGNTFSLGLGYSYPKYMSRMKSLTYSLWLEHNYSKHSLLGVTTSKDLISKAKFDMIFDKKDSKGRNFLVFSINQGLGKNLGGMENDSLLSSRSFSLADNLFTKFGLNYSRIHRGSPNLFWLLNISGQASTDPLVTGEQWAIGGANSVRGHIQSTYLGDDGYTANLEMRLVTYKKKENSIQLVGFVDHGEVSTKKPTLGQNKNDSLSGAGFGLRVNFSDSLTIRSDLGFSWGKKTTKSPVPYIEIKKTF